MIKEVIFDIDNTLYDYEPGHEKGLKRMDEYAVRQFQKEPGAFLAAYKVHHKETTERLGFDNATIHSRSIRIQNVLEDWGKPLFPHVKKMYRLYWDTLLDASRPEPGSLEALRRLKNMGITVGIGTDMTAWMQYEKLERLGFAPYINHIVTSQEAGYEKPHLPFMELCLKKAGCSPKECVFVGDTFKKDVKGAVLSGMHAVWYNAKGKETPEDAEVPKGSYQEIRHFEELVPYICALNEKRSE